VETAPSAVQSKQAQEKPAVKFYMHGWEALQAEVKDISTDRRNLKANV
jgi:hypothetical protein